MAFKRIWITALILLAAVFFSTTIGTMLGLGNSTWIAVLATVGTIMGVLTYAGVKLIPFSGHKLAFWTLGMFAIAFFVGAFATYGLSAASLGVNLPSASLAGGTGPVTIIPGAGFNAGSAATVTVYALDKENNNPMTKTNLGELRIYVNGAERPLTGTSNAGTFGGSVGQAYRIVGGNATMYVDEVTGTINSDTETTYIPSYTATTAANLAITCYDTSGTVLGAANNASLADYNLTVGANADVQFSCKLAVAASDAAYNLGAITTWAYNNTKDAKLTSFHSQVCQAGSTDCNAASNVGFSSVPVPTFLKNIKISPDTYSAVEFVNAASYTNMYKLNKPIRMQEYDELRYAFVVTGGSTDPAYSTASEFDGSNLVSICFLDAVWTQGADGNEYMSYVTVNSAQTQLGVDGDEDNPVGKDACVVIQVT